MAIRHDEEMIRNGRWEQIGLSLACGKNKKRQAVFQCQCGKREVVDRSSIKLGHSTSCGCWNLECARDRKTTHGMSGGKIKTPTYLIWKGMRSRCFNVNHKDWMSYGGRGISVCDRWSSFSNFIADMGERPDGLSLDRKNNEGNYESGNCRWVTRAVQSRNTRTNVILCVNGRSQCVSAWAEEIGVRPLAIFARINRGWSDEEAILTPLNSQRRKK